MLRCTRCEGFIPAAVSACPNCSRSAPRGRGILAVLGAGAAAITLMACYGMPPCTETTTADGGFTNNCGTSDPVDAGTIDAGPKTDAGTCDAGTSDAGC